MNRLAENFQISVSIPKSAVGTIVVWLERRIVPIIVILLSIVSICAFAFYSHNGLSLAYNDARSHLDIGRRVVEGLKPGMAQLGSVWLPLPHVLMIPTVWNDYMWHTGLSGAIVSMFSFVITGYLIYRILGKLDVGLIGKVAGVVIYATNINILYLQSTAMTELLLLATMTAAVYELINYYQKETVLTLIKCAFWVMLATLVRYDGWFLFFVAALLVVLKAIRGKRLSEVAKNVAKAQGLFVLFCTLAGFGVFLWFLWNAAIFKDPLYFAFGPYSAHAQQEQLASAGVLITQHNWAQSLKTYWYAMLYNSGTFSVILGAIGVLVVLIDRRITNSTKAATLALMAPLFFNILALYLGHSVLFIQGINGDTWFNVRYGIMMMPSIAIFVGFLIDRAKAWRVVLIGLLAFTTFFAFASRDAVTIDDGRVGSSQKNVSEISGWLRDHTTNEKGFVLISAASHDAIIFSSGLPMSRFIHEGTGEYWKSATTSPDRWARWIVMRTNDENDQTFKLIKQTGQMYKYTLVNSYPFADIYQLGSAYVPNLITEPVLGRQK